jgi:transposase
VLPRLAVTGEADYRWSGNEEAEENLDAPRSAFTGQLPGPRKAAVCEVVDNFPEECRFVLETQRGVYRNDALARERELSPEDRLRFHQEHSRPLMDGLHKWMEAQFAQHKTEPNSGLGKAISYLLNHWPKLTLFLEQAGAPLDNNIAERALKNAILNRKNALFYKTLNGANPFDYLTELQRHAGELKQNPSEWMPWNYRVTLARLVTPAAA